MLISGEKSKSEKKVKVKILKIYIDILYPEGGRTDSLLLMCGLCTMTSFQTLFQPS